MVVKFQLANRTGIDQTAYSFRVGIALFDFQALFVRFGPIFFELS